jgi:hypothetical protein
VPVPRDDAHVPETTTLGTEFAHALAAKDFDQIRDLLHPQIDFRGLTSRRIWDARPRCRDLGGAPRVV